MGIDKLNFKKQKEEAQGLVEMYVRIETFLTTRLTFDFHKANPHIL